MHKSYPNPNTARKQQREREVEHFYLLHRATLGVRESIKATSKSTTIPISEVCVILGFDGDFLVSVL